MALPVDGNAADLAENPVVRQRLWPGSIHRKGRNVAGGRRNRKRECNGCNQDREGVRDVRERTRKACAIMPWCHGNLPFWPAAFCPFSAGGQSRGGRQVNQAGERKLSRLRVL